MYLDILKSEKISSLATGADRPKVSYTECLESIISLREAEFRADSELLTKEFSNYHLGLEAEDSSFWAKIQTIVRKLMELLKTVAAKITAYIQTVPGRIHNFVLRVSNWAAKIGLESKLKNAVQNKNSRTVDPEKEKAFAQIEFGPMNFDEILCGANTAAETQNAEQNAKPSGAKVAFIKVCAALTTLLSGFTKKYGDSVKAAMAKANNASKTAGADTAAASGQAATKLADSHAEVGKVYTLKQFLEEDDKFREGMQQIDDAARAMGETKKWQNGVPDLNTAWNMLKTVTNGNIERQANSIIQSVDRGKRGIDAYGRLLTAEFNKAYAAKDSEKVHQIREALSTSREVYTTYIKIIVRIDTAAQRCTSNVIKFVKEVMACYKLDQAKVDAGAEKETVPESSAEQAEKQSQNQENQNQQTSDNVQDFSHIFDF